jgi:hypothetical protein
MSNITLSLFFFSAHSQNDPSKDVPYPCTSVVHESTKVPPSTVIILGLLCMVQCDMYKEVYAQNIVSRPSLILATNASKCWWIIRAALQKVLFTCMPNDSLHADTLLPRGSSKAAVNGID